MQQNILETARKLSSVSTRAHPHPAAQLQWPDSIPTDSWFTSPEFISLYGTDIYESLDETARKKLSFWEAVNFYSLNINGEKPLVEGLNRRLYSKDHSDVTAYLHHFLDEENKHMQYFGRFCMQYAKKVYSDKKVNFPRTFAPGEEDFLFFAKVMIFEEIADFHNIAQGNDDRLHPLARSINQLHHQDEARHLIFGREWVAAAFGEGLKHWSESVVEGISEYLKGYLVATWKEYYNPQVYLDSGLQDAYSAFESAWQSPAARSHRQNASEKVLAYLYKHQIIKGTVYL